MRVGNGQLEVLGERRQFLSEMRPKTNFVHSLAARKSMNRNDFVNIQALFHSRKVTSFVTGNVSFYLAVWRWAP